MSEMPPMPAPIETPQDRFDKLASEEPPRERYVGRKDKIIEGELVGAKPIQPWERGSDRDKTPWQRVAGGRK